MFAILLNYNFPGKKPPPGKQEAVLVEQGLDFLNMRDFILCIFSGRKH